MHCSLYQYVFLRVEVTLSLPVCEVLQHLVLAPVQLHLNAWRILISSKAPIGSIMAAIIVVQLLAGSDIRPVKEGL